jgi:AraC-like DNA-binding protein
MVARILDLIFIQILRAWAAGTDAEPNWLAGALDPQIGPALGAIHRHPGHDWTVDELARAHVRLDAATELLRDTSLPVTLIAENVGYTSEAAFSRAFKHRYGTPPARWRRDIQAKQKSINYGSSTAAPGEA